MSEIIEFKYKGSEESFRNLIGIDERAQAIALKYLMQAQGHPPVVPQVMRTIAHITDTEFDDLLYETGMQRMLPPSQVQPLHMPMAAAYAQPTVLDANYHSFPTIAEVPSVSQAPCQHTIDAGEAITAAPLNQETEKEVEIEKPTQVFQRRLNLAGLGMAIVSTAILVGTISYFGYFHKESPQPISVQAAPSTKPSQTAKKSSSKPASRQSVVDKVESLFGPIAPGGK